MKPEQEINELSLINQETIIEGKITATQDVRIDGTLKGEIESENKLIVGELGIVDATIKAKEAKIYGELNGNIELEDSIYINRNAKVNADIVATNLIVENGSSINGKMSIKKKII